MTQNKIEDPYLGLSIDDYILEGPPKHGKIGFVYKAVRGPDNYFACKIIPIEKLKPGWENELSKVHKLKNVPNVIEYIRHGSQLDKNNTPFIYIFWNYIDGENLKEYMANESNSFDLPFIFELGEIILKVLYACKSVDIIHGDLHEGNILISRPDHRLIDKKRTIWVSDFGFGGSRNDKQPKDDFKQLYSIMNNLLSKIIQANLTAEQRILHEKIKIFFDKKVLERDPMQGTFVGNLDVLIKEYHLLPVVSEYDAARAKKGKELKEPGDYLVAEALGYKVEEWKNLFVPNFLAVKDLLSKNISVLTGARGCGKTMTFRRLTAYMDNIIGESSGVDGADQFVGFYLNCRSIIEAFPFIPNKISTGLSSQIIHYFHLSWFAEICKTFSVYKSTQVYSYEWLETFVLKLFKDSYVPLPTGADILSHIRAFIEDEKERTRLTDHGRDNHPDRWILARRDFLDEFTNNIKLNLSWAIDKPFYFFLDDYTIPTIPRSIQIIINQIIFKRRDNIFFKISTESSISFVRVLERNKPLELHQDFELIDLASESLHQDYQSKKELLENIFIRRIERDELLKGKGLSLVDILGKMEYDNNLLAKLMRDDPKKKKLYSGVETFIGMWSSDIRIMIQMFVDMLKDSNNLFKSGQIMIARDVQDKVYKNAGGEFLGFAENVPNPAYLEKQTSVKQNLNFGTHLKDIVEAFINVARFELTKGELVSNQGRKNPKQAFRLEILDHFQLDNIAYDYYEGLIRWHIFFQDRRGKSIRGMLTPRLFLNRVMIPHAQLTFSTHDHIHINNQELNFLLKEPQRFVEYWKKKRNKGGDNQGEIKYD